MNIIKDLKKKARLLACTFIILCFCATASAQDVRVKDSLKQNTQLNKKNPIADENQRRQEASIAAVGARLAEELNSIGIPTSESELKAIVNSLTAGGKAATDIAMFIIISIAEVKQNHHFPANAANPPQTFTPEQAKALLEKLQQLKADSLTLMKYIKPRIEKLRN